jgi:hypothetical protein
MRRFVGAMVAVALSGVLIAPTANAQVPAQDAVTGDALLLYDGFSGIYVRIDATSGPSGEGPAGTVSINICSVFVSTCATPSPELGGGVTCLNVRGNRAIIGYYGGLVQGGFTLFRARGLVEVVDNGSSSAAPDTLDIATLFTEIRFTEPNPDDVPISDCPDALPAGSGLISGPLPPRPRPDVLQDFTVTDAQPLPTSKEQCKKGGWQAFGIFKNQGDCVSFVATGGKSPPGTKKSR